MFWNFILKTWMNILICKFWFGVIQYSSSWWEILMPVRRQMNATGWHQDSELVKITWGANTDTKATLSIFSYTQNSSKYVNWQSLDWLPEETQNTQVVRLNVLNNSRAFYFYLNWLIDQRGGFCLGGSFLVISKKVDVQHICYISSVMSLQTSSSTVNAYSHNTFQCHE